MSSLVVSGQASREEALAEVTTVPIEPDQAARDLRFIAKKLRLTVAELTLLIEAPPVPHTDYENDLALQHTLLNLQHRFRRWRNVRGGTAEHEVAPT